MPRENRVGAKTGKFHFNVLDAVIIIVIILAAVGIVLRSGVAERLGMESRTEQVKIRFLVKDIDHTLGDSFVEGTPMFFCEDDSDFGVLSEEKTIVPAVTYVTADDGTVTKIESSDGSKIDLRTSVVATGVYNADGYFLLGGNVCLTPGMEISVRTDKVIMRALITEILRTGE